MTKELDLILYANDNGATVTEIKEDTDIDQWIVARVRRLEDDPYHCSFFHLWKRNDKWYAEYIWPNEFEDELMLQQDEYQNEWRFSDGEEEDFSEENEGHPGHPHEYGDST